MKQESLYSTIKECGFSVLTFSDFPSFFGCWSISIIKNNLTYMIEHEGRDSWLVLYREVKPNKLEEIDRKQSHNLNESRILEQCKDWLSSNIRPETG